jgi:phenylpyruvate tautomerase PptA (4-oxalocrotonate tautomerase family)
MMANYSKNRTYSRAKKPKKVEEKKTLVKKVTNWVKKVLNK